MFKVNNKDVVLVFLLLTCTYFTPFSSVSIVNFEDVIASWAIIFKSLTSSNSNLFKDTDSIFHFLVLSSSFLFLFRVGTLKILKVLRLMFWLC